jgi:hypothetical protein
MVSLVQREWVAKNPRATLKTPITVENAPNSRMIAYPFRLLQYCLVTDGGGASTRKLPYSHRMWSGAGLCAARRGRSLHRRA